MKLPREVISVAVATVVSGATLGSTWVFAEALHRHAAHASHELAATESWLETATPTSPALVRQGRRLFLDSCAHCHGADASGDEGPDLRDLQVSDRYIARMITFGEPHEMPAFAKKHGSADIAALTAYLRSLAI